MITVGTGRCPFLPCLVQPVVSIRLIVAHGDDGGEGWPHLLLQLQGQEGWGKARDAWNNGESKHQWMKSTHLHTAEDTDGATLRPVFRVAGRDEGGIAQLQRLVLFLHVGRAFVA